MSETPILPEENEFDPSEGNPFVNRVPENEGDDFDQAIRIANSHSADTESVGTDNVDTDNVIPEAAGAAKKLLFDDFGDSSLPESSKEKDKKSNTNKKQLARIGIGATAAAALTLGGVIGVEKLRDVETVAETTFTVQPGGTVIEGVQEALPDLLGQIDRDLGDLDGGGIIFEAERAQENNGGVTKPGDQFTVELKENGFERLWVEISPYEASSDPTEVPESSLDQ